MLSGSDFSKIGQQRHDEILGTRGGGAARAAASALAAPSACTMASAVVSAPENKPLLRMANKSFAPL
jgi:hypothetical protein